MRRLFNEYEAMTAEGNELADRVEAVIRPLIIEYWGGDASVRDVENIIHSTIASISAEVIIRSAVSKRKAERIQKEQE